MSFQFLGVFGGLGLEGEGWPRVLSLRGPFVNFVGFSVDSVGFFLSSLLMKRTPRLVLTL